MAIDTAAKRFSMLNFGRPPICPLFIPDGSVDDGDRYHLLNLYSGIALSAVTAPTFLGELSDLEVRANTTTKTIDYSGYFTDATSYSISPALESGWSLNTSTGILTIDATTVGTFGSYVITGTNAGGSANSNAFYIKVIANIVGGNYGGRSLKPISDYEDEIRKILAKEEAEKLKEKKALEKKETKLEAKILSTEKTDVRQKQETRLKLVSESLLQVEKDLVEISKKRAKIKKRARIMRDDDEVIAMLMREGWL